MCPGGCSTPHHPNSTPRPRLLLHIEHAQPACLFAVCTSCGDVTPYCLNCHQFATCTGYGDVTPYTDAEMAISLLYMIIGAVFFGYIIGCVGPGHVMRGFQTSTHHFPCACGACRPSHPGLPRRGCELRTDCNQQVTQVGWVGLASDPRVLDGLVGQ